MTHVSFIAVQRGRCFRWCRSYVTSCSGQTRIASFTTSCLRPNLFKRSFVFTAWTVHRLWNRLLLIVYCVERLINWPFMDTSKPQSNGTDHYTAVRWLVHWPLMRGRYIWYSEEGPGQGRSQPRPVVAVSHPTHQHPVYQLHIIWCSTIASGL